jgi:WD40 repeat protein
VCFSPDGKQLATGSYELINLYSFNDGNAILAHTLEGHTYYVRSLSFSPDCKLLCSGSWDRSIKFGTANGSL